MQIRNVGNIVIQWKLNANSMAKRRAEAGEWRKRKWHESSDQVENLSRVSQREYTWAYFSF